LPSRSLWIAFFIPDGRPFETAFCPFPEAVGILGDSLLLRLVLGRPVIKDVGEGFRLSSLVVDLGLVRCLYPCHELTVRVGVPSDRVPRVAASVLVY